MAGSESYLWPPNIEFYLDACLPRQIAEALRLVEYPIHDCDESNKRDVKDEKLIPWLGELRYVWITRDDAAKKAHAPALAASNVPTIWVRGIDRQKKTIRMHDVEFAAAVSLTLGASAGILRGVLSEETLHFGDNGAWLAGLREVAIAADLHGLLAI